MFNTHCSNNYIHIPVVQPHNLAILSASEIDETVCVCMCMYDE